jgi:hypothetical protein
VQNVQSRDVPGQTIAVFAVENGRPGATVDVRY